jgi:hypothetical protein
MRRSLVAFATIAAGLVLLGTGCAGNVETGTQLRTGGGQGDGALIDAAASAALGDGSQEQRSQSAAEQDAGAVNSDDAALDAYGNSNYEVK